MFMAFPDRRKLDRGEITFHVDPDLSSKGQTFDDTLLDSLMDVDNDTLRKRRKKRSARKQPKGDSDV